MSESWIDLIMDSVAHMLIFSTPTHTHDFDNYSNGYSHLNTTTCGALADCQKSDSSIGFETRKQFQNLVRITIFKIAVLLIWLDSLMICTHGLTILTKTKEMTRYCESFGYGGKTLSTHISIILMQVSVPTEDGSNMPLRGPALLYPLMPLADQHLRAQSCPLWTSSFVSTQVLQANHKQQKSHKQQRRHTQP
jgi:hypothetical protein